jgi:hypothetical protein
LKIYHALKETSDLSDTCNLTGFAGIATSISKNRASQRSGGAFTALSFFEAGGSDRRKRSRV